METGENGGLRKRPPGCRIQRFGRLTVTTRYLQGRSWRIASRPVPVSSRAFGGPWWLPSGKPQSRDSRARWRSSEEWQRPTREGSARNGIAGTKYRGPNAHPPCGWLKDAFIKRSSRKVLTRRIHSDRWSRRRQRRNSARGESSKIGEVRRTPLFVDPRRDKATRQIRDTEQTQKLTTPFVDEHSRLMRIRRGEGTPEAREVVVAEEQREG